VAEDLLVLSGVTKGFGGILAVDDVSMVVGAGEIVGLVGPNGAGKTTLFNCVSGMVRQDAGTITFDGVVLDHLAVFRRARLGIGRTFQRVEVFPELSVRDHLLVADRAHRRQGHLWKDLLNRSAPTADELARADETMDLVGLSDLADTPVAALGLGSCRLVELARSLMTEPRLLMADEPSSGLDGHETAELSAVLRTAQRRRGLAVLLVEHDLGMVGQVVDRTVVLDLGQVLTEGGFDEVMADPVVRRAYLGRSA
jgi:branched-chain amino acid transport system ATP-binding protein